MGAEQSPVVLVAGDAPLLVQRAEEALIQAALPEGRSGFTFASYLASEGADGAMDTARTMPMMARRRVVVIREIEAASAELLEAVLGYLQSPSPSTLLLLVGQKLPTAGGKTSPGARLLARIEQIGVAQDLSSGAVDPERFVQEQVRAAGCRIEPAALRLLLEMVGRDLGALDVEVEKAVLYAGQGGTIDEEAVAAVCCMVSEADVWSLTNALVRGDTDGALAAMHRLLEEGKDTRQLMPTVAWQIRSLLELQDSMWRGGGLPRSWSSYGKRQAAAEAQKLLRERPLPPDRILRALSRARYELNRSRAGDRRVFEGLILSLVDTSPRPPPRPRS